MWWKNRMKKNHIIESHGKYSLESSSEILKYTKVKCENCGIPIKKTDDTYEGGGAISHLSCLGSLTHLLDTSSGKLLAITPEQFLEYLKRGKVE